MSRVVPMDLSRGAGGCHGAAERPLSQPMSIHSRRFEAFWTKAAGVYVLGRSTDGTKTPATHLQKRTQLNTIARIHQSADCTCLKM